MYLEEWRNNGREATGTVTTSATLLTDWSEDYTGDRVSVILTNTGATQMLVKWNKSATSAPTITSADYYVPVEPGQEREFAARESDIHLWAIVGSGSTTFTATEIR